MAGTETPNVKSETANAPVENSSENPRERNPLVGGNRGPRGRKGGTRFSSRGGGGMGGGMGGGVGGGGSGGGRNETVIIGLFLCLFRIFLLPRKSPGRIAPDNSASSRRHVIGEMKRNSSTSRSTFISIERYFSSRDKRNCDIFVARRE